MKFGFGITTWINHNHWENLPRMFDELSLENLDGVEFFHKEIIDWYGNKPAEFGRILKMHDLELSDYYAPIGYRTEELHKATLEEAKRRYRFAAELGCKNVLVDEAGGGLPLPCSMEDYVKRVAEGTNEIGEFCNSLGLTLSWHNHWGSIFETSAPFELFVENLDNDKCGLCFDVGQLALGDFDVVCTVRKHAKRIKFMHMKDVCFRGRPTKPLYEGGPAMPRDNGAYDVDSKGRWVELGRGDVDLVGVMQVLREVGYDGWLVDDLDTTPYDPRMSARACKEYINYGLGVWTEKDKRLGLAPADAK